MANRPVNLVDLRGGQAPDQYLVANRPVNLVSLCGGRGLVRNWSTSKLTGRFALEEIFLTCRFKGFGWCDGHWSSGNFKFRLRAKAIVLKQSQVQRRLIRPKTMVDVYLKYDAEFQVCICVLHECAIPTSYIERHFRDHHKDLWPQLRKGVKTRISQLRLRQVQHVQQPEYDRTAVKYIKVSSGHWCLHDDCNLLTTSRSKMDDHDRKQHKGLQKKWRDCSIQTLFSYPNIRYIDFDDGFNHI